MKSKEFTLIELLAVIVILAIIALIATPIILNIIDDTEKSSKERSKELYLDEVFNSIAAYNLKSPLVDLSDIVEEDNEELGITVGDLACGDNKDIHIKVEMDGEKPKRGTIQFIDGKIESSDLSFNPPIILAPGLYDENDELIHFWDELVDKRAVFISEYDGKVSLNSFRYRGSSSNLKLIIDDSITSIRYSAFCSTDLTSVVIPSSVTKIRSSAFNDMSSLTSITIPNSVTSMGRAVFSDCSSLTEVTLLSSLTIIGEWSFQGCTKLSNINYRGTEEEWQNINFKSE